MNELIESLLADGLAAQGIECDQAVQQKLIAFVHLMQKWNTVYNLTAIRDPRQGVIRHILDSLSVVNYIQGTQIIDVGAGAGLPGIPLALLLPDFQFTECDSVAKKTRFIQQAITELALHNVEVITARVENLWSESDIEKNNHLVKNGREIVQYDTVISRAFASLTDMIAKAGAVCKPGGLMLAMKGVCPDSELAEVSEPYQVQAVEKLTVYGLDEQRTLVILKKGS